MFVVELVAKSIQMRLIVTDEGDRELFRESIGKVRRLNADKVHLRQKEKPKPIPQTSFTAVDPSESGTRATVMSELSVADTLSFVGPGLQKTVLRKLKRGFFGIDAELDLHGLTAYQAKRLLENFIKRCLSGQIRCVHIIHGKGYRSPGQKPILKNKLNFWLRQHPGVLAFCSAPPSDGGTGAVYVLLDIHR